MTNRLGDQNAFQNAKQLPPELSTRYLAALKKHFKQDTEVDCREAHAIGKKAVANGLQTLDLAMIHDRALLTLLLPDCSSITRKDLTKRAMMFFTEAITQIEMTHPLALKAIAELKRLNTKLLLLTQDLANSNSKLQQSIPPRQDAEKALAASHEESGKLAEQSRVLCEQLQATTRQLFSAQEKARKAMSIKLQHEIAQSLLGIQVRLIALKNEVSVSNSTLKKEIAITQRWIEKSVKAINRAAREFGVQLPA